MLNTEPIISIVIPNYNKANYLHECFDSLFHQTYSHWEALIVDDASTDTSRSVIEKYRQLDPRFHVQYNGAQQGGNYCRNLGLKNASGKYVVFLDSDDILDHACLKNRIKAFEKKTDHHLLVFTSGVFYKKPGDDPRTWIPVKKNALTRFLSHDLPWHIMQPIWNKDFLLTLGGFDESFERLQDVELHTRALFQENIKFDIIETAPDCYYRIDQNRLVFNQYHLFQKRVNSSVRYIQKFYKPASQNKTERSLLGTYLKLLEEIAYCYRKDHISEAEYKTLVDELSTALAAYRFTWFDHVLIRCHKAFNYSGIKIPGMNYFIKYILIR